MSTVKREGWPSAALKEIMAEDVAGLWKQLSKEFADQLPRAFIFPDTSARPIAHSILPLVRKICEQRKISRPLFAFVCADRDRYSAQRLEERCEDILKKSEKSGLQERVIIFDDVLHHGKTASRLNAAFLKKNIRSSLYALVGVESRNFLRQELQAVPIHVGFLAPPAASGFGGEEPFFSRHIGIGVVKNIHAMRSQKDPAVDQKTIAVLRSHMKDIGDRAAALLDISEL